MLVRFFLALRAAGLPVSLTEFLALLDVDEHGILRLSPRSLELQNQIRPAFDSETPMPSGPASAMTFSTNYALFIAVDDRVYFAMNAH